MKKLLFAFILFLVGISNTGTSQDSVSNPIKFEIERLYPSIWVTQHTLDTAQYLVDLNPHFKPSWVREYINVEIITIQNGKIKRSRSDDDQLTPQQLNSLREVDPGSTIEVKVLYIPENNLRHNEPKDWNFSFVIEPQQSAEFSGGKERLVSYLKEQVINQLNSERYQGFDLNTIKFTVDEQGQIVDAHIFWPSSHEDIDSFLLESVCNMPAWKPAQYHNGLKIKQEFFLAVGNMDNCVMNLLDIKKMVK